MINCRGDGSCPSFVLFWDMFRFRNGIVLSRTFRHPMSFRGAKRRGNLLVRCIVCRKPKGYGGGLYHSSPRVEKSNLSPGDSHVALRVRNDIFHLVRIIVTGV